MRYAGVRFLLFLSIAAITAGASPPILDTAYQNPPFSPRSPAWAKDVCGGKRYFENDFPPYGWMPVSPEVIGASGVAVMPNLAQHDVPFTHPFGLDWEFFLALDSQYASLLADGNRGPDSEFVEATRRAAALGLSVTRGVLGVEIDQGLIPPAYRAEPGDRIAIFGNWIVDCGHTDFHTEIHPPLVLACARTIGRQTTQVLITARPWLVTERFTTDDEPIRRHLLNEVVKLETMRSLRVEAHPEIRPPFSGMQRISFTVRPPSPRRSPRDRLMVSFHFTVRHGVTVLVSGRSDAAAVLISMDAAAYTTPPLPPRHDWEIPVGQLRQRTGVIDRIQLANAFGNPLAAVLLSRDWLTDHYEAPVASSPHDSELTTADIKELTPDTPFFIDDAQPFPIYGRIRLEWRRNRR